MYCNTLSTLITLDNNCLSYIIKDTYSKYVLYMSFIKITDTNMTTKQFIEKCVQRIDNGEVLQKKYNGSVMVDGTTIYSYGYHYPLLFRIEDKEGRMIWVCNNAGYSNTTLKHISWCVGIPQIYAKITGTSSFFSGTIDKAKTINALKNEIDALTTTMNTKKRKNTAVYDRYDAQKKRATEYLNTII